MKVRDAILAQEDNGDLPDNHILEIITEGETVWEGEMDTHRWYILQEVVVAVGDLFVWFQKYIITGDNSMSDMGLEYDLDDFALVERKERVVTEVYYE